MNSKNLNPIKWISRVTGGKLIGNSELSVRTLSIDSRSLYLPEEPLFFAITGKNHDGHDYISSLYEKGVRAFVISKPEIQESQYPGAAFILVQNTLTALQTLAAEHRKKFDYPVIAITGSNGKTIVKEWLYRLLNQSFSIVRSPKSYNSQVGVPLSVWNMNPEANLAIFEAGISQPGEMEKLAEIVQPTVGVFTHLGEAHLENFNGKLHLLEEKLKLFSPCRYIVYCADEQSLETILLQKFSRNKLVGWSRKRHAFLHILHEEIVGNTTKIGYQYLNNNYEIVVPFTDKASVNNAITCIVTALTFWEETDQIKKKVIGLEPIAMRMEIKEGAGNCTLINDYYNSDLGSVRIAIDLMNRQQTDKQKTIIISDIHQSEYPEKKLYRLLAKLLSNKGVDRVIGIGKNISRQANCFDNKAKFYTSTDNFLRDVNRSRFRNEIILIKGARDFHFERISKALQFKAHRTILEVDLTAMIHNLNYFRSLLQSRTKLMVMVKAFSYGSGSTEIANLLQYHRVDYLAVAIADEGVELRNAGINTPIIVMNPEPHSFETMIEYRLEPEIYNQKILLEFRNALRKNMTRKYPIHIKLDTGMHRMGFLEHDLDILISEIRNNDQYHICSIFSHLAGADEEQHDGFTRQQIKTFKTWSNKIQKEFNYPIDRHVLNSAGIERFPEAQFEMVRLGIGLYGISPVHQDKLRNVNTLKTTISQIKSIPREKTVGYGRKGVLTRNTRIGIIPIGYADGFSRKFSNGVGKVIVNGKLCPIVGNVCMDMSMIDLSHVEASEGDSAIIFGDNYPVTELAHQLGTIPYEILATVSRRVKRIYVQE